jgi:hypothetical protein
MKLKLYFIAMSILVLYAPRAYGEPCPFYEKDAVSLNADIRSFYQNGYIPAKHPAVGQWRIDPQYLPLWEFKSVNSQSKATNANGQCTYDVTSTHQGGQNKIILDKNK